jgi:hypothetical protein
MEQKVTGQRDANGILRHRVQLWLTTLSRFERLPSVLASFLPVSFSRQAAILASSPRQNSLRDG